MMETLPTNVCVFLPLGLPVLGTSEPTPVPLALVTIKRSGRLLPVPVWCATATDDGYQAVGTKPSNSSSRPWSQRYRAIALLAPNVTANSPREVIARPLGELPKGALSNGLMGTVFTTSFFDRSTTEIESLLELATKIYPLSSRMAVGCRPTAMFFKTVLVRRSMTLTVPV